MNLKEFVTQITIQCPILNRSVVVEKDNFFFDLVSDIKHRGRMKVACTVVRCECGKVHVES